MQEPQGPQGKPHRDWPYIGMVDKGPNAGRPSKWLRRYEQLRAEDQPVHRPSELREYGRSMFLAGFLLASFLIWLGNLYFSATR